MNQSRFDTKRGKKRVLVSHDWFDFKTDGIKDGAKYVSQALNVRSDAKVYYLWQSIENRSTNPILLGQRAFYTRFSTPKVPGW